MTHPHSDWNEADYYNNQASIRESALTAREEAEEFSLKLIIRHMINIHHMGIKDVSDELRISEKDVIMLLKAKLYQED